MAGASVNGTSNGTTNGASDGSSVIAGDVKDRLELILGVMPADRRARLISWVEHELKTRPIIDACTVYIDVPPNAETHAPAFRAALVYTLGEPSPCSSVGAVVFAMLMDEKLRAVVVYTFQVLEVNGQQAINYFREMLFDPKFIHGAITWEALYDDVREFVVDENRELVQLLLDRIDEGVPIAALHAAIEAESAEPVGEG